MEVWVGALGRYGPLGQLWRVLATFIAKNSICCYLKKGTSKRAFLGLYGPRGAGRGQIRFGGKICVEPVKMLILPAQIATFVCDTTSLRFTVLPKSVSEAKNGKNRQKWPKNRIFRKSIKCEQNLKWTQNWSGNVFLVQKHPLNTFFITLQ